MRIILSHFGNFDTVDVDHDARRSWGSKDDSTVLRKQDSKLVVTLNGEPMESKAMMKIRRRVSSFRLGVLGGSRRVPPTRLKQSSRFHQDKTRLMQHWLQDRPHQKGLWAKCYVMALQVIQLELRAKDNVKFRVPETPWSRRWPSQLNGQRKK